MREIRSPGLIELKLFYKEERAKIPPKHMCMPDKQLPKCLVEYNSANEVTAVTEDTNSHTFFPTEVFKIICHKILFCNLCLAFFPLGFLIKF